MPGRADDGALWGVDSVPSCGVPSFRKAFAFKILSHRVSNSTDYRSNFCLSNDPTVSGLMPIVVALR